METLKDFAPFLQTLGTLLGVIVGGYVGFRLTRWSEPYKLAEALKTRQKEIQFARLFERQLDSLEGINKRTSRMMNYISNIKRWSDNADKGVYVDDHKKAMKKAKESLEADYWDIEHYLERVSIYLPPKLIPLVDAFDKATTKLFKVEEDAPEELDSTINSIREQRNAIYKFIYDCLSAHRPIS